MFWVRRFPVPYATCPDLVEHYFELSKPDAKRALDIYRTFVKQTDLVVQYLSVARLHEHSTRLEIPKIKHAPTSLTQALEEYLNDKDFETNRRQYMVERESKKPGGKTTNGTSKLFSDSRPAATSTTSPTQTSAPSRPPDVSLPLIDFFDSINDNQQTMAQPQAQQYPQQTGYQQPNMQIPQQTADFQQQQQQQPFGQPDGQSTNELSAATTITATTASDPNTIYWCWFRRLHAPAVQPPKQPFTHCSKRHAKFLTAIHHARAFTTAANLDQPVPRLHAAICTTRTKAAGQPHRRLFTPRPLPHKPVRETYHWRLPILTITHLRGRHLFPLLSPINPIPTTNLPVRASVTVPTTPPADTHGNEPVRARRLARAESLVTTGWSHGPRDREHKVRITFPPPFPDSY
jgi:hypothetical protein